MSYKPSDFVASFGDVVSVLMPGAVATYALAPTLISVTRRLGFPELSSEPARWVAFVVAAYFLGHLVFLLGAFLDYLYDPLRRLFQPPHRDRLYKAASACKSKLLGSNDDSLNTYKYAKAVLGLKHEAAGLEVQRLEAESKFFRNTTALLTVLLIVGWGKLDGQLRFWGATLLILSFWRYAERRWKSTQLAYAYLLALQGARGGQQQQPHAPPQPTSIPENQA